MKTTNIDNLIALQTTVSSATNLAVAEFKENLEQLFVENSTLSSIRIRINNHEFNDGSATQFSLYYEDMTVTDVDEKEIERNDYGCDEFDRNRAHPLMIPVFNLFDKYDVSDIYERVFGEQWESIDITKDNINSYFA